MNGLSEDEIRARLTLMWFILFFNWEKRGLAVTVHSKQQG